VTGHEPLHERERAREREKERERERERERGGTERQEVVQQQQGNSGQPRARSKRVQMKEE